MIKNITKNIILSLTCFTNQVSFSKVLYKGDRSLLEQKITTHSFGSGRLKESSELSTLCLRLDSNNLYSGGEILFSTPFEIKDFYSDKNLLLTLDFFQGGKDFIINKKDSSLVKSRRKFEMKISLLQESDQGGEIYFSVEPGTSCIGFPLGFVKGLSINQPIIGLRISTNSQECLYLNQIYFSHDSVPIQGKILTSNQEIGLGEEIKFNSQGFGGTTPVQFQWAINPKSIFQVDGTGSEWSYRFLKSGTYYVRLIITDLFGFKKPFFTFKKITVNP